MEFKGLLTEFSNSSQLVPTLRWMKAAHILPPYLFVLWSILVSFHLCLGLQHSRFPSDYLAKILYEDESVITRLFHIVEN